MAWEPTTGTLWTVVNERDGLGDEIPPDYLTSRARRRLLRLALCLLGHRRRPRAAGPGDGGRPIVPDYALGGHTASLGLCWLPAGALPGFPEGMVIGQHGSWNRSMLSGYKLVFVPFADGRRPATGRATCSPASFRRTRARPMAARWASRSAATAALLVADDVGDVIWRVTGACSPGGRSRAPNRETTR